MNNNDKKTIQLNVTDEFISKLLVLKYNHDNEGYQNKLNLLIEEFQGSLSDKVKSIKSLQEMQKLHLDRVMVLESLIEIAANLGEVKPTELEKEPTQENVTISKMDEKGNYPIGELGTSGGVLNMETGEWTKKD